MGDIIVIGIILLVALGAIIKIKKDKEKGASCGCGCGECPSASSCRDKY